MTAASDFPEHPGLHLSAVLHAVEAVEMNPGNPARLPAAALHYARAWGWPVFPCQARGKKPLTSTGFLEASTDEQQIRDWWGSQHPQANIGIPTGPVEYGGCGFDVIDIDGDVGIATFAGLAPDDIPPPSALSFTPGNPEKNRGPGRHHFIPATGDGNAAGILPGVDYRGRGGFFIAAPSLGPNGVSYAWIMRPEGKA